MNSAVATLVLADPTALLDRHEIRRTDGIPTISLLVGPTAVGGKHWRRWAAASGRLVVPANQTCFPWGEWVTAVAQLVDLPQAGVRNIAPRAGRDESEFVAAWRDKTAADRERFWNTIAPQPDDDLLRVLADLPAGTPASEVAATLAGLGDRVVGLLIRLIPPMAWPSVLFVAPSMSELSIAGVDAVEWSLKMPAISIAIATSAQAYDDYRAVTTESRCKALLREGEIHLPVPDAEGVDKALTAAGAPPGTSEAIIATGDPSLVEPAIAALEAAAAADESEAGLSRARSAAEKFLFEFLETLPETAGRFEVNGLLDFRFGLRAAEVDLLCRSSRIAIELDGHFHFQNWEAYRRDRGKDWELQKRGFVVLRFLATDVIADIENIRDRILEAITMTNGGAES